MTRVVSIVLSILVLFQSFNIHLDDIVELDELIEHAKFHAEEYGDDFFVFISKHYGELKAEHNQQHQEEKEDHEQLPFQHQGHTALSPFVLSKNTYSEMVTAVLFKSANFFYQASYHSLSPEGPLHPPRFA